MDLASIQVNWASEEVFQAGSDSERWRSIVSSIIIFVGMFIPHIVIARGDVMLIAAK